MSEKKIEVEQKTKLEAEKAKLEDEKKAKLEAENAKLAKEIETKKLEAENAKLKKEAEALKNVEESNDSSDQQEQEDEGKKPKQYRYITPENRKKFKTQKELDDKWDEIAEKNNLDELYPDAEE